MGVLEEMALRRAAAPREGQSPMGMADDALDLLHRIAENTENTVQSREQYGWVPLSASADAAGRAISTWNLPSGFVFIERLFVRSNTGIVWTAEVYYDAVDPVNEVDLFQPGGTGRVTRTYLPRLVVPEHRQAVVFDVTGLAANGFVYINLQYQQVTDDPLAPVTGDTSTG